MAPIIAPETVRYTVHQTIGGQPVANIIDMVINSSDPLETREEVIFDVAGDILNNWSQHIQDFQTEDITALRVSWLDLSSLDGSRGERTSTSEYSWPRPGQNTDAPPMPAVVSARVDKATSGGRGTKGGRMYLSGIPENWTSATVTQTWDPATVDEVNTALEAFYNGITESEGPDVEQRDWAVIHTQNGVFDSLTRVTGIRLNPNISTQVRRGVLR